MRNLSFNFITLILASSLLGSACSSSSSETKRAHYDSTRKYVICFGDSLTKGAGLSIEASYPSLLKKRLQELGYPYEVINLGVNGETTQAGKNRLTSVFQKYPADEVALFVLALSGNDGLRSIPVNETEENLKSMLQILKAKSVPRLLVGLKFIDLKLFGRDRFEGLFERVSEQTDTPFVADMLEGVRLKPQYNLSDGVHPNEEGTKLVFDNIWPEIEKLLPKPE